MIDKHFKNCMAWRVFDAPDLAHLPAALGGLLQERPAGEPVSMTVESRGWVPPLGDKKNWVEDLGTRSALICMNTATRKLSGKVVKQEVARRAAKLSAAEDNRKVTAREKQRIKEAVVSELLPKAFVEHSQTYALIRGEHIYIATGSAKTAEALLDLLRATLGSLKVRPVAVQENPLRTYTNWFTAGATSSEDFELGNKFVVHDEATKRKVSGTWEAGDTELAGQLIRGGARATTLELVWENESLNERIRFTTNEMLGLKGVQWPAAITSAAQEDMGDEEYDDTDLIRGIAIIVVAELEDLWTRLTAALGGEHIPELSDDQPEPAHEQEEDDDDDGLI